MPKCPNCQAEIDETDKRCSECGFLLEKKSSSSKLMIIGIVVVVLVIAVIGAFATGMFNGTASDSSVNDKAPSETVEPITDNDSNSSAASEYWASSKAEKFHTPDCEWAQKISEANKIVYHSREDAIEDGKVPCGACNP